MDDKNKRTYNGLTVPAGEKIRFESGKPVMPLHPIIPFIEGDGIGKEVWAATRKVVDAAVSKAYGEERHIAWFEVFAGGKANDKFGKWLPEDTVDAIRDYRVAIKGPLNTPVAGGIRSINVTLRQTFDLYSCVRPVRYFPGVPSVVVAPEKLNVVIFRENTEDVYAGIEYKAGSNEAKRLLRMLKRMGHNIRNDSGIGIKPISRHGSRRLVRAAIRYALENGRSVVTLVHKGNIQKFTEGSFRDWGYELAKEEFGDKVLTWDELVANHGGKLPEGKILLNDRIADAMFFEVLTRPEEFSVIATTNLNGDYLSDACAAQVGGLGIAPGANIGDECAIFEATHGTAPTIAGKNVANPGSLLLSAVMMLDYIGWTEAARLIVTSFEKTIGSNTATNDIARLMPDGKSLSTSEFADELVKNLPGPAADAEQGTAADAEQGAADDAANNDVTNGEKAADHR
ncbi:MAG TPA: isocitrate dehydrogenase (NADP(+)) [Candidatus Obscuribacterales bacterium]